MEIRSAKIKTQKRNRQTKRRNTDMNKASLRNNYVTIIKKRILEEKNSVDECIKVK